MADASADPLQNGIRLLNAGDLAGAQVALSEAANANPQGAQERLYLGICLARRGDIANAIPQIQYAAQACPSDPNILFNLGVALAQAHRVDEARTALEQVLAIDPTNARAEGALRSLAASAPPSPSTPDQGPPAQQVWGQPQYPPQQAPGMVMPTGPAQAQHRGRMPNSGEKIGRGLGWGLLCGQIWTAWFMFWEIVSGAKDADNAGTFAAGVLVVAILVAVAFALGGAITGLITALTSDGESGPIVGVVMGLVFFGLEFLLLGSAVVLINVLFWYFTGRIVGTAIGRKIAAPVLQ